MSLGSLTAIAPAAPSLTRGGRSRAEHKLGSKLQRVSHARGYNVQRVSRERPQASAQSSPAGQAPFKVEVVTFDLDDTLWATSPTVELAHERYGEYLRARIPAFPADAAAFVKQCMRDVRRARPSVGPYGFPDTSYSGLRILGAAEAARRCGVPEGDALVFAAQGFHLAWLPGRHEGARRHLYPGTIPALTHLREAYPSAVIGSITNGAGSGEGAGLGAFFDFEISGDLMIDLDMVSPLAARKPHPYPFERARAMVEKAGGWSGRPEGWVHVGDDVLNDCVTAKTQGLRTVRVCDPATVKYSPGGGEVREAARAEASAKGMDSVDVTIGSVAELADVLAQWEKVGHWA